MARRKSENKMTTEERIESIKLEIVQTQEVLATLKNQEKELIEQKKQEDLNDLIRTMELSNLSIADVQTLIAKTAQQSAQEKQNIAKNAWQAHIFYAFTLNYVIIYL